MKSLMDKCVSPVIELILDQIKEASRLKGRQIKVRKSSSIFGPQHTRMRLTRQNVFLVGGFGASPYLQEELQESLSLIRKKLRRPDAAKSYVDLTVCFEVSRLTINRLTAVVQGGVIFGCEKGAFETENALILA